MRLGALCAVIVVLPAIAGSAWAQPVRPLPLPPRGAATLSAEQHAEIHASVAATKADVKVSRATREQIQALRQALRAKLAAMRH
jgi:hypothetical protein